MGANREEEKKIVVEWLTTKDRPWDEFKQEFGETVNVSKTTFERARAKMRKGLNPLKRKKRGPYKKREEKIEPVLSRGPKDMIEIKNEFLEWIKKYDEAPSFSTYVKENGKKMSDVTYNKWVRELGIKRKYGSASSRQPRQSNIYQVLWKMTAEEFNSISKESLVLNLCQHFESHIAGKLELQKATQFRFELPPQEVLELRLNK